MIKTQSKLLQILQESESDLAFRAYTFNITLEEARFSKISEIKTYDLNPGLFFPDKNNSVKITIFIKNIEKELTNITEEEFQKFAKDKLVFNICVPKEEEKNEYLIKYFAEMQIEDYINLNIRTDQEVVIKNIEYEVFYL